MIAAASDELGGFAAILLGLLILVVAIVWILFPILVLIKFNDLLKASARFIVRFWRRTPCGMK